MSDLESFKISNINIGINYPPFCIAEVGINHNGDLNIAKKMVDIAKKSGADAVKFQTFKANEICSSEDQTYTYLSKGKQVTESMLKMFQRYEFSIHDWREIKDYCSALDIIFFSTPQNYSDLNLLLELNIPAIKIGSDDFTNIPLIELYAKTNIPLILSCGMANLQEVHESINASGWKKGNKIALLICTSQYPTPLRDVNLNKIKTLHENFPGLIIGFSDHTEGYFAASIAVGMGARILEKHFTLDKNLPGPDHWFSSNPDELTSWVSSIKNAYMSLGSSNITPTESEIEMRKIARRTVTAIKDIKIGDTFDLTNISLLRPGIGIEPRYINKIIGKKSKNKIESHSKIKLEDFE